MNIRVKLIVRFTIIVATLLMAFSLAVYLLSENYRREEFFSRLESRALTTARLLVSVEEVNMELLRIIDKNTIYALPREKIQVFNADNKLLYGSNNNGGEAPVGKEIIERVRKAQKLTFTKDEVEYVGIVYSDNQENVVVVASAFDRYGRSKLRNLRNVLLAGLIIGIIIIVLAGAIFARQVLSPLARLNAAVSGIGAGDLGSRIDEGNRTDEIARLAMNFNNMLSRLESAFETQKQFVSNASHELRNPLAAMSSQLQLMLDKERSAAEYQQALRSLLDDNLTLIKLTNGLLALAQSDMEQRRLFFAPVRVDETIFLAQDELAASHSDYRFFITFDAVPEDESALTIPGDEQLLRTAFLNLMDNACKFSVDRSVSIRVSTGASALSVWFVDKGVGIPPDEQEAVFTPFYRAQNVKNSTPGHGIGLSLCRRIVELHRGELRLQSELGKGSSFELRFPLYANI
jgi:signal transduction histidine kinase